MQHISQGRATRARRTASSRSMGLTTGLGDGETNVVWVPPAAPQQALRNVYWMHAPKTGSSFLHTILSFACGETAQRAVSNEGRDWFTMVKIMFKYERNCKKFDCCPFGIDASQWRKGGGFYHEPVMWRRERSADSVNVSYVFPGHMSVVAIFRRPAARLLSGLRQMQKTPECCYDWGFTPTGLALNPAESIRHHKKLRNATLAQYAASPGALGCQAKMLLGIPCHAPRTPLTSEDVALAAWTVRRRLRFVGLLEHWAESVCLWHSRFGGALTRVELLNSRATQSAPVLDEGASDAADEAVYSAATERFWREVAEHNATISSCLRAIAAASSATHSQQSTTMPLHGKHCIEKTDAGEKSVPRVCYSY